jgi:hypothetical protein
LVSDKRAARFAGVVAQQAIWIGDARHRKSVLGLRIVDAVSAREVAARVGAHVHAAAQRIGRQLERQYVARPAQEIDRHHRPPAHRVDVGERVGRRDAAPVVRVVHHRREEVGRRDQRHVAFDAHHGRVVTVLQANQQLGPRELAAAERAGRLTRIADGVVLGPDAFERATEVLEQLPQLFTVSEARRAFGTSRRVAVPLLEQLDAPDHKAGRRRHSKAERRWTLRSKGHCSACPRTV